MKKWIQTRLDAFNHHLHTIRYAAKLNSTILFGLLGFLAIIADLSIFHAVLFLILFIAVDIVAYGNGIKAERDWTIKHP